MDTNTTPALTSLSTAEEKVDRLLSQQKISLKDIEFLNDAERLQLGKTATEILSVLTGAERNRFIDKIEAITDAETKNCMWQNNHYTISNVITNFMCEHGVMPINNKIAELTGFSRQTIAKHLKEYKQHPEFAAVTDQFKYMSQNVLSTVFKFAKHGDMKAARLYFEMVGALNKQQPGTVVNTQNNYIQINNTILSQENLKQLSAEQLDQIEKIVTNIAAS